jgi:shikimate dehydrogenase
MKLALIGKKISHSQSPQVYRELLDDKLSSFDLLDYIDASTIPTAEKLFTQFDGISITSPYKQHFLSQVSLVNCPEGITGINCMRKSNNIIEATNTDYLGIRTMLVELYRENSSYSVAVLGDGVMSQITEIILKEFKIPYKIYSRKRTEHFDQLSFENSIVINSCSRDFIFKGKICSNVIFWDYNYSFLPHQTSLPITCERYVDGLELLQKQAKYAIEFWDNSK